MTHDSACVRAGLGSLLLYSWVLKCTSTMQSNPHVYQKSTQHKKTTRKSLSSFFFAEDKNENE